MTRRESQLQHLANFLAGTTGVAFAWFKYGAASPDPYSAIHPAEPWMHSAHVLFSPLLLFAVGVVWRDHVWKKLRKLRRPRRRSGVLIAGLFVPMGLSAYLIQVSVDESWRRAWVAVHLASSALWIAGYLGHMISSKK